MNPDPCHPTSDPGGCSSVGRAPALQAGGRRFDSVHLHQLGHPVMPTPFRFSRRGIWFGAPRPEATRVSKRARGRGCDEGRPTLPGFFLKAKSSARLLRCLSLWIGLFDEGFDWAPSRWMCAQACVRRRRPVPRLSSGLDEHVCLFACGVCPCA